MSYPLPGLVVDPQGVSTSVTVTDGTGATATVYSDRYGLSPVSNPQTIVARTTVYVPGSGRWTVTANSVAYAVTLEGAEVGSVTIAQSGSGANGVPVGGTTNQALVKNSNTDYDTKWSTIASGPTVTSVAYAATVTPAAPAGGTTLVLNIGTLTGSITLANPTGTPTDGQKIELRLSQDGTGGRTLAWGAAYAFGTDVTTSLIPSAPNSNWIMLFEYNAANTTWRAVSIIRGF